MTLTCAQVLSRMLEVQCLAGSKQNGSKLDRQVQTRQVKDALFWLIDHLNLTEVIEERCDTSPWTWMGSMFYAGQLYTTIGEERGRGGCQLLRADQREFLPRFLGQT